MDDLNSDTGPKEEGDLSSEPKEFEMLYRTGSSWDVPRAQKRPGCMEFSPVAVTKAIVI